VRANVARDFDKLASLWRRTSLRCDERPSALISARLWPIIVAAGLAAACSPAKAPAPPIIAARLTHGAAIGEVTATSAIAWGRCDHAAAFHVQLDGSPSSLSVPVAADRDFIGTIAIDALKPDTAYRYRAWCGDSAASGVDGSFRTAPSPDDPAPLRFAWSGDLGGQNACRDSNEGYFIFDRLRERSPAFFVALGDMIYADETCQAVGLYHNAQIAGPHAAVATTPSFWEHWRYNRADLASEHFFLSTPYYAVWDDHEINNDAGPHDDTLPDAPNDHRLPPARAAFVDYQPFMTGEKLYRSFRWGKYIELFILDLRTYRDAKLAPDNGKQPKTMLGAEQRRWLIESLSRSDATWKIVVSSVPISVPTAGDGWSDFHRKRGFHRELETILKATRDAHVENMVWITTDVHFATGFVYEPDKGFTFLEFTSGPLSAGMFPKPDLDKSLHPRRLYYYGGPTPWQNASFAEARPFLNFGELEVDASGALTQRIVNSDGQVIVEEKFSPH